MFIGAGLFCAFLILFVVIGVLANKSEKIVYRDAPSVGQEPGESAVSGPQMYSRSTLTCQKCSKNPNAKDPNLDYAKCILDHYPLVDG